MKIKAPNQDYYGLSAGVVFTKGVGETNDPVLLAWFRQHGYEVEEVPEKTETKKAAKK